MTMHVRTGVAALVLVGALAGCGGGSTHTYTSSPSASSSSSEKSTTSEKTTTSEETTTSEKTTAVVPAPANSMTITCKEWRDLDDPTQLAVVTAIVQAPDYKGVASEPDSAKLIAKGACLLFGSKTVADVLATGS
jgi:hypothetical protein